MSKSQVVFASSVPDISVPAPGSGSRMARAASLAPPTLLGRYALFGRIGAGGMGVVHLGRLLGSAGFERPVAVKRIHPALASDQEFIALFRDELRLLARVRHQHVIAALDVVEVERELLLVMEYVHGESLAALLQRTTRENGAIPVDVAVTIACGVLKGLHAAHTATSAAGESLGIIHRDVSPHNVLVGCDGVARIVDFGVAKWAESRKVTRVGELRGKPGYVAPEQISGEPATPRSDVYALSVVLWEMLAGQRLFGGKSAVEIIERVVSGEVPAFAAVSPRQLPELLESVVRRGLSRDPAARFATAREMAAALEATLRLVSSEELGDWVTRTAGEPLAERARQLAWAENCAIGPEPPDAVDDLAQTLVRPFPSSDEQITRDLPVAALASAHVAPRIEPPSPPRRAAAARLGKPRALSLLLGAIAVTAWVGARLYHTATANAEEAVRARAALAVARAGLNAPRSAPSLARPPVVAAPVPPSMPEPAPVATARAVLSGATSQAVPAPPARTNAGVGAPRVARPVPPKPAASVKSDTPSVDGF